MFERNQLISIIVSDVPILLVDSQEVKISVSMMAECLFRLMESNLNLLVFDIHCIVLVVIALFSFRLI